METLGTIFGAIKAFYAWPFQQYAAESCNGWGDGHCADPKHDVVMTVIIAAVVISLTALVVYILWVLFKWLHGKCVWYSQRQHCTHCGHWTLRVSRGKFSTYCSAGQPCCPRCNFQHRLETEPKVSCPRGHGDMEKVPARGVLIYDRCTTCRSVFLDDGELDELREWARDEGYDDGNGNGLLLGIAVGSAIN